MTMPDTLQIDKTMQKFLMRMEAADRKIGHLLMELSDLKMKVRDLQEAVSTLTAPVPPVLYRTE